MIKSSSKTYCIDCGVPHTQLTYPKICKNPKCEREMYKNPIPVVVILLPVKGIGILLGRRAISPKIGSWALPGGFVDEAETYDEAARRELKEEMNISYKGSFKLLGIESPADINRSNMIIMLQAEEIKPSEVSYSPTLEVSEIKIVSEVEDLAFPVHQDYLKQYFNSLKGN